MIKGIIKEMKDIRKFVNDNQDEIIFIFSSIFLIIWGFAVLEPIVLPEIKRLYRLLFH